MPPKIILRLTPRRRRELLEWGLRTGEYVKAVQDAREAEKRRILRDHPEYADQLIPPGSDSEPESEKPGSSAAQTESEPASPDSPPHSTPHQDAGAPETPPDEK